MNDFEKIQIRMEAKGMLRLAQQVGGVAVTKSNPILFAAVQMLIDRGLLAFDKDTGNMVCAMLTPKGLKKTIY